MLITKQKDTDNVDFKHPEYAKYYNNVKVVNDIYDGVDTAKNYLIPAPREEQTSIDNRKKLATLKNYVKRATEAFVGMIFRKDIQTVGFSDDINAVFKNVDKTSTLNKFSRELTTHLIRDGKVFLLVDTPIGGGDPYMTILDRISVINWKKDANGVYTLIVYKEVIEEEYGLFGIQEIEQWRVFNANGDVDIYRIDKDGGYYIYQTIITDFNYIPIVDITLDVMPPLYDISKLNIKHMNRTSLKDKYLDMSAIPIPVIWGAATDLDDENAVSGNNNVKVIGVDEAFVLSGTKDEADFQWRELSGNSIQALQNDLKVIEEDITSGVIRAAQSDNTTIKTATQSFYEAAESANRVTVIANAIEIGLNKAVQFVADLLNEELDPLAKIIVNKDFNAITQNSDNIRILWEIYLGGALSIETFLTSMEKFELVDVGSVEEEIKKIEQDNFNPVPKTDGLTSKTMKNMDNRTVSALNKH